jgi:hypothetical protein
VRKNPIKRAEKYRIITSKTTKETWELTQKIEYSKIGTNSLLTRVDLA